jgi:hypothetical protein
VPVSEKSFEQLRKTGVNAGLADRLAVLATRFRTTKILALAERHVRAMEALQGGACTILPADGDRR